MTDKTRFMREMPRISEEAEAKIRVHTEGKYEELADTDHYAVKGMIRALEETGQLVNPYVFFVTDNGFSLGQHRYSDKRWPYEESARTPLLARGPDVPAGTARREIAANIDLPATVAEIAGFDPAGYDGRCSLLPFLRGESVPWRDALSVSWRGTDARYGGQPGYDALVMQDNRLYVEYETGETEYYDMNVDLDQARSLAGTRPGEEAALAARLAAMRGAAGDAYRAAEVAS